jgi:hypothetical protein
MICIGIDPGTHTGVAVWDTREGKFLSLETLPIHRALEKVKEMSHPFWHMDKLYHEDIQVVFEDARQRTWFGKGDTNAKAQGAGSVKRDCSIWEDFCKDYEIPFKAQKPQAGGTKWNKEYWQKVTGWTGRSSEHSRDAALLVFGMR